MYFPLPKEDLVDVKQKTDGELSLSDASAFDCVAGWRKWGLFGQLRAGKFI